MDSVTKVGDGEGMVNQMKEKDLIKERMCQVRSGQFVIVVRDDDEPWPCSRSQNRPIIPFSLIIHHARPI